MDHQLLFKSNQVQSKFEVKTLHDKSTIYFFDEKKKGIYKDMENSSFYTQMMAIILCIFMVQAFVHIISLKREPFSGPKTPN